MPLITQTPLRSPRPQVFVQAWDSPRVPLALQNHRCERPCWRRKRQLWLTKVCLPDLVLRCLHSRLCGQLRDPRLHQFHPTQPPVRLTMQMLLQYEAPGQSLSRMCLMEGFRWRRCAQQNSGQHLDLNSLRDLPLLGHTLCVVQVMHRAIVTLQLVPRLDQQKQELQVQLLSVQRDLYRGLTRATRVMLASQVTAVLLKPRPDLLHRLVSVRPRYCRKQSHQLI